MIRKTCLALAALIATSTGAATGAIGWGRVADAHGSSVELPVSLLRQVSKDGVAHWVGRDGGAEITLETVTEEREGFPGNDPAGDLRDARLVCGGSTPSYLVSRAQLAAFSCTKGTRQFYYLAKYIRTGSVALEVSYPTADAARWRTLIPRMAASLRQQGRTGGRPG